VIRRGEIYWVELDPSVGSETKKTRPSIIISNDQGNQFSSLVTILPITSQVAKVYPFEVFLSRGEGGIKEDSKVMINQIRTADKQRLKGGPLGFPLNPKTMDRIEQAIKLHLDIR
jgi:mRNA interferase MazF